jgi:hypothetical protein
MNVATTGRPSSYTSETATFICEQLAEGKSLREICRTEEMPSKSSVMRWLASNTEFRDHYARARELQAEHYLDEIVEIADDGTNDWIIRQNEDGSVDERADHEHISRSKLRVDARKWLMSKMAPKKYGDKIMQEHSGPDGGPIPINDTELARKLAFLLTKADKEK